MTLASLAGLHLSWAAGSAWPARDRTRLAQLVAGTERMPDAGACLAVGAALGTAAVVVAGGGGERRVARRVRRLVAAGFLVRGAAGLSGQTGRLVSWTPSAEFARHDRRLYGPLCLLIGASVLTSAEGPR